MKQKIQAFGKYLSLIQDEPESGMTKQGLIIPDSTEKETKAQGIVDSVGEAVKGIKRGDYVIFGAYAGDEVKMNTQGTTVHYRLIHEDDVLAKIV
jgi:co-chaperonin GroES (HSP10)